MLPRSYQHEVSTIEHETSRLIALGLERNVFSLLRTARSVIAQMKFLPDTEGLLWDEVRSMVHAAMDALDPEDECELRDRTSCMLSAADREIGERLARTLLASK